MIVTARAINAYREKLHAISEKAAEEVQKYMLEHAFNVDDEFLDFVDEIVVKYGEAAGALSAEFYDNLADYWNEQNNRSGDVQPAEIADLPTEDEVAKTVYGTLKESDRKIPGAISRLVKRTAEDTTLKNAIRDGADFAWIPAGDTCPFCLMLASRGWQRASKKALKNGHAEHIHANCNCTYAVRFGDDMKYPSYNPDIYMEMYESAEGDTWEEKLNSMRRAEYAENRETIRAQKREAYARVTEFRSVLDQYKKDATPGVGKFEIPKNRMIKNREEENMRLIYREYGGDIRMLPENPRPNVKNADLEWRGEYWEDQEPVAYTRNAIDANIREGIHQIAGNPGGIVLDIGKSNMPIQEIKEITLKRLRRSSPYNCDVMIIRNETIEDIFRYKKIKK